MDGFEAMDHGSVWSWPSPVLEIPFCPSRSPRFTTQSVSQPVLDLLSVVSRLPLPVRCGLRSEDAAAFPAIFLARYCCLNCSRRKLCLCRRMLEEGSCVSALLDENMSEIPKTLAQNKG
jgi:hypothetical protein